MTITFATMGFRPWERQSYQVTNISSSDSDEEDLAATSSFLKELKLVKEGRHSRWRKGLAICIGLVLGMVVVFQMYMDGGTAQSSIIPNFPTESVQFVPMHEYMTEPSPESDKLWNTAYPGGVHMIALEITEARSLGLGEGLPSHEENKQRWGVSWTHQYHCLQMIREALWENFNKWGSNRTENDHMAMIHISHCFDYLRQTILCHRDMTIESRAPTVPDKPADYPHVNGYNTWHTCTSKDAVDSWMISRKPRDATESQGLDHSHHGHHA